jgi:ketosteroid isomerase-like protein
MDASQIKALAKALDDAIENEDVEKVLSFFTEDCETELLGLRLEGRQGLKRALDWMYMHVTNITLTPITILIDDSVFFEEFLVKAKTHKGKRLEVKQAEVLIYNEDYLVTSLRLYFDRLLLADTMATNFVDRILLNKVIKSSLKGLE